MTKYCTIFGLMAASGLLLYWGGTVPIWLLRFEIVVVMLVAGLYGFSSHNLSLPRWLMDDAMRGITLVYLGIGSIFCEPKVLLSAFLIGNGTRMIMRSAISTLAVSRPTSTELVIREATDETPAVRAGNPDAIAPFRRP